MTRMHRYGLIPLVEREVGDAAGRVLVVREWDPDYRPGLPAGAVRGGEGTEVLV